jgi:hypothetical protein
MMIVDGVGAAKRTKGVRQVDLGMAGLVAAILPFG